MRMHNFLFGLSAFIAVIVLGSPGSPIPWPVQAAAIVLMLACMVHAVNVDARERGDRRVERRTR